MMRLEVNATGTDAGLQVRETARLPTSPEGASLGPSQ